MSSSSTNSALMLGNFPGDLPPKVAFPEWLSDLLALLSLLRLIGFVITEADHIQQFGVAFIPAKHPGPPPDDNKGFTRWSYFDAAFKKEQDKLFEVTALVLSRLDFPTKELIKKLEIQEQRDLKAIINVMIKAYGTLATADVHQLCKALHLPYVIGTPFSTFIAAHTRAHNSMKTIKLPVTEFQKVEYLKEALRACNVFELTLQTFDLQFGDSQTFDALATMATVRFNNMGSAATSRSEGYAAAAIATDLSTQSASPTDFLAFLAAFNGVKDAIAAAGNKGAATPRADTPKKYCWTHGINGSHSSGECSRPGSGHDNAATLQNKRGGCTTTFVSFRSKQQPQGKKA